MRLHRKKTAKQLSFLKYRTRNKKGNENDHNFFPKNISKDTNRCNVDFPYIEMIPVISPSKLNWKYHVEIT